MSRAPKPSDDVDRYIAERDAREPGFAALVAKAENKQAARTRSASRHAIATISRPTDRTLTAARNFPRRRPTTVAMRRSLQTHG